VAQQLEVEGRRRLLAAPTDPALARRLATILRIASEAGTTGARDGRARLQLELLAIDSATQPVAAAVELPAKAAAPAAPRPVPAAAPATPPPAASPPATPRPATPIPAIPPESMAAGSASHPSPNGARPTLAEVRARWGEVVERAHPVVKPLIKECRPYELDGVRLTLAFPEGREFMRGLIAGRARSIEDLLGDMFGGAWSVEAVAASVDLEPLTVEQAISPKESPEAAALLQRTLEITGGQLVDAPEVR
ncbi:MAG TPA: hypothetical protein VMK30_02340, partial [Pleomorphomonadaceae bacterium]|nr:hypothetical protein [Pleomorphomonadaceae bacterium]